MKGVPLGAATLSFLLTCACTSPRDEIAGESQSLLTGGPRFSDESATTLGPLGFAPGVQSWPAVSWTGLDHFVVWQDGRDGAGRNLYGARIAADGQLRDPLGLPLVRANGNAPPALSWNGNHHLLAWNDCLDVPRGSLCHLRASRIDRDGRLLDAAGIVLAETVDLDVVSLSIGWNGTQHLVSWFTGPGVASPGLFAVRVSADGQPIDKMPLVLSRADLAYRSLSVATQSPEVSARDGHLVVWSGYPRPNDFDSEDLFFARVSNDGKLLDPLDRVLLSAPNRQGGPQAVWGGANYLVAYGDERKDVGGPRGVRVQTDGTIDDASGFSLGPAAAQTQGWDIAPDGSHAWLLWRDLSTYPSRLQLGRLTIDGATPAVDAVPLVTLNEAGTRSVEVSAGPRPLLVWSEGATPANPAADVFAARVAVDLKTNDPSGFLLSSAARPQINPVVSSNGHELLTVWLEPATDGHNELFGMRLGSDGMPIPPGRITFSDGPGYRLSPNVTWTGSTWVVAWLHADSQYLNTADVRVTRLDGSGTPLGTPAAIAAAKTGLRSLRSSFDGHGFLLLGTAAGGPTEADVAAQVMSADGTITSGIEWVSAQPRGQRAPEAVWNGTTHLVVWEDERHGLTSVYGARVTPAGKALEPFGIPIARSDTAVAPVVAWNGQHHLVAWHDRNAHVRAVRISADGIVEDSTPLALDPPTAKFPGHPSVGSFGDGFVVGWLESVDFPRGLINLVRVDGAGDTSAPSGFMLEAARPLDFPAYRPALAELAGRGFLAYAVNDHTEGNMRVRGRFFDWDSPGSADADSGDGGPTIADGGSGGTDDSGGAVSTEKDAGASPEAASTEAGDHDVGATAPESGGCSCQVVGGGGPDGGAMAPLIAGFLVALARRRRRVREAVRISETPRPSI